MWSFALSFLGFLLQLLQGIQLLHTCRVWQPHLHADKWLPPLDAQWVPGLGLGEELTDRALAETKDSLTEKFLAEVVSDEDFFYFVSDSLKRNYEYF